MTTLVGRVTTRRGQLLVQPQDGAEVAVPVADVALVLFGQKVALGGGVVHYLAQHDVSALMCDWRGVPLAGFHAWSDHTRVGARQIAQANLTKPRQKNAWLQLIKAKILGQAATLALVDELSADYLLDLASQVRSGDPNNLEAAAARWYWRYLFADRTFSREQDGSDNTNAMLNYGYGILRGLGIRAAAGAGLTPALGVFHSNRSNPFNLVEDLIEPFRPIVDACVLGLPADGSLEHPAIKQALVATATTSVDGSGLSMGA
ncbi:MAG: type II CRISPR-associated endonuclease Cas1, partial [Actinomycetales bacterium]|nr:type II CRISPR-associated endonuclease Cas1 [Actinomycetales bacterium]